MAEYLAVYKETRPKESSWVVESDWEPSPSELEEALANPASVPNPHIPGATLGMDLEQQLRLWGKQLCIAPGVNRYREQQCRGTYLEAFHPQQGFLQLRFPHYHSFIEDLRIMELAGPPDQRQRLHVGARVDGCFLSQDPDTPQATARQQYTDLLSTLHVVTVAPETHGSFTKPLDYMCMQDLDGLLTSLGVFQGKGVAGREAVNLLAVKSLERRGMLLPDIPPVWAWLRGPPPQPLYKPKTYSTWSGEEKSRA